MVDREQDELGEEIEDFRRRVTELESVRSLPAEERLRVLDATLFELRHAADQLWPRFRALCARSRSAVGTGRQEERLLRALFQRHPLPMALLDRETVVRRMNHSAARLMAAEPGYATGRPLTGFLKLADRAAFRTQVAAVARDEGDRSLVVRLLPGAETLRVLQVRVLQVTLVALRPPGEPHSSVMAVVQAPGHRALLEREADDAALGTPAHTTRTERGVELLDVLDHVAAALLGARDAGPEGLLRATADALARNCADWVIADLAQPDGPLRRIAVCGGGPGGGPAAAADGGRSRAVAPAAGPSAADGGGLADAAELAAQDPGGSPMVVAAAGGAVAVQARPEDLECLGRDSGGSGMVARLGVTSLVCLPVCATPGGTPVPAVLTLLRTANGGRPGFSMAEAGVLDRAARLTALALALVPAGSRATTPRP